MKAILHRFADTPFGVFGFFDLYDELGKHVGRWATAEDDWKDNLSGESCIPAATYICKRDVWHKKAIPAFQITGVPGRDRILIHFGNTEEDVKGCVIVGLKHAALEVADEDAPGHPKVTKWAVVQSRPAFDALMQALAKVDTFDLEIRWAPPGSWRKEAA